MTDHHSLTIKDLAHRLQTKFQELDDASHKVGSFKGAKEQLGEDAATLSRLIENFDMISAVFPVYGVVKAGKSTLLACLIGEMVLPEQAAPMTSIPIRIKHVSDISEKRLVIPQYERWNCCITGFEQKLLSGTLDKEFQDPTEINGNVGSGSDAELYRVQELIRSRMISFSAVITGDAIRTAADVIRYNLLSLSSIATQCTPHHNARDNDRFQFYVATSFACSGSTTLTLKWTMVFHSTSIHCQPLK